MPYDKDGYTRKTEEEIIKDKEDLYSDLFGVLNNSPSDYLWQMMKLSAIERQEIEMLNEVALQQMSIQTAEGIFLDKWGIECGIERKGERKAQGYVLVEKDMTDEEVAFNVPAGTAFISQTNRYLSDEDDTIPKQITLSKTKTGESDDYFPTEIEYVESIEEIEDQNGNIIDSSYYSLNSTYNNYIEWTSGSSAVLSKNQNYTVTFSGTVKKRIEVTSELSGEETNASIDTVSACVDFPALTTSNPEKIDGGAEEESDTLYRERLLQAKRRTFTLENIRDIVLGLEGVRSCKVYQNVGTDQSSISDWDNYSRLGTINVSGTEPMLSQEFVPGDQIATLGRITLRGRAVNDPPAIYCGIKRDVAGYDTGTYLDYVKVEEYELDTSETGIQDIEFNLEYNGMDKTKTYRFDIWCENPDNPSYDWATNHWKIETTNEGYIKGTNDSRGEFLKLIGGSWVDQGSGTDLIFKTSFNGAGFTVTLATEDGYGYENVSEDIEGYLDYVEEGGFSPVCIQSYITQAEEIEIDIQGNITITQLADFTNVRRELEENIEDYLELLNIGDNVVYAKIHQIIMNHEQVTNLRNLKIKREDQSSYGTTDLGLNNEEIADLGTTTFQRG